MKILLVDDHVLVREGVRRLLSAIPASTITEASTSAEALACMASFTPDVVILDISLPDMSGLEIMKRLLAAAPHARVLVLSMYGEARYAAHAMRAGAQGFVSKGVSADELLEAVQHISSGKQYVEREIATELALRGPALSKNVVDQLTPRELAILKLIGEGSSTAAIAAALGVSPKTVANACSQIKSKLFVERTAGLVRIALELQES